MSRVALSAASPNIDDQVGGRFGQSEFLLLVDTDTMSWEPVENPGRDPRADAGLRAARLLCDRHVSDVISGMFGPDAHDALQAAGIVMHRCDCGTTCRRALELLKAGELPEDFWK
jgi:predicted Fe-Mo cluster-binding NifX family protein